jgi:hypothetical protein
MIKRERVSSSIFLLPSIVVTILLVVCETLLNAVNSLLSFQLRVVVVGIEEGCERM